MIFSNGLLQETKQLKTKKNINLLCNVLRAFTKVKRTAGGCRCPLSSVWCHEFPVFYATLIMITVFITVSTPS